MNKRNWIIYFLFFALLFGILIYENKLDVSLPFILMFVVSFIFLLSQSFLRKMSYKKINSIEFEKEKNYFRELIEKYSIAELSYLDEFELNNPKDIIAVLLVLEKKKIIEIKDDKINIISNNFDNLKESEKYILNHIKDGYLILDNDLEYIYIVEKECENDNLLQIIPIDNFYKDTQNELSSIKNIFLMLILSGIILIVFGEGTKGTLGLIIFIAIILICLTIIVGLPIIIIIKTFKYSGKVQVRDKLLDEGKIVYYKLNGLKKYLKDFTAINTRESDSLIIWDDYLIYSVFFNINKKIIDDYCKLLKMNHYISRQELINIEYEKSDFYRQNNKSN